jgi:hypothetical protein
MIIQKKLITFTIPPLPPEKENKMTRGHLRILSSSFDDTGAVNLYSNNLKLRKRFCSKYVFLSNQIKERMKKYKEILKNHILYLIKKPLF